MTEPKRDPVPRAVVAVSALVFLGFGFAFLLAPAQMAAHINLLPDTPTALSDIRAVYGGLEVGLGLYLGIAALRRSWLASAVTLLSIAFAGVVAGRITSLVVDGTPGVIVFLAFALEAAGLLASLWAAARMVRSARKAGAAGAKALGSGSVLDALDEAEPASARAKRG